MTGDSQKPPSTSWWIGLPRDGFSSKAAFEVAQNAIPPAVEDYLSGVEEQFARDFLVEGFEELEPTDEPL